jgi:hypothetical protein
MTQNYGNHRRFVPPFHFFILPVLLLNVIYQIYKLAHGVTFDSVADLLLAIALLMVPLLARFFALKVQDRVIRLEERLRMAQILPGDLRGRIDEFTVEQLVALRFANDAELPELARKVLTEKIDKRKPIKQMITNWRGDYLRA